MPLTNHCHCLIASLDAPYQIKIGEKLCPITRLFFLKEWKVRGTEWQKQVDTSFATHNCSGPRATKQCQSGCCESRDASRKKQEPLATGEIC